MKKAYTSRRDALIGKITIMKNSHRPKLRFVGISFYHQNKQLKKGSLV